MQTVLIDGSEITITSKKAEEGEEKWDERCRECVMNAYEGKEQGTLRKEKDDDKKEKAEEILRRMKNACKRE